MTRTKKQVPEQPPDPDQKTDQDLLAMMPAKDASPEEWRAFHQALFDAGRLTPPETGKKG